MNPIFRNTLAVVAGGIVGMVVNMGIIMLSGAVIPPPEGVDVSDVESIKAHIHLYEPKHFLFPFLAHALGTLVGAYVAALIAINNKMRPAIVVGVFFLIGGIMAVQMIPGPIWFAALDLVMAYIPMAWLGSRLATRNTR